MPVLRSRPVHGGLFHGGRYDDYISGLTEHIRDHIRKLNKSEALTMSEDQLVSAFYDQYEEEPPVLDLASKSQLPTRDVLINSSRLDNILSRQQPMDVPGTLYTVAVPFVGGLHYFELNPSWGGGLVHGEVVQASLIPAGSPVFGELHFKYEVVSATATEIAREFNNDLAMLTNRLSALQKLAENFNRSLKTLILSEIRQRKQKLTRDDEVAAALGIPFKEREGAPKPFSVNVRERIKLVAPPKTRRSPSEEWRLEEINYEMILGVIRDLGRSMERTASAFESMKEPHLRDIILFVLNGHFRGGATGETFNAEGKTDILMRWNGKNAFIAECKYWDGRESLLDAIDQLGSYTCWSDTKATLLMITKKTKMSTVLAEIKDTLVTHPRAKSTLEERDKNEFRIALEHPTDEGTRLTVTVLVYNVRRQPPAPSSPAPA